MANNLHISYDLASPGRNYEGLIERIKALGNWAKIHQSFWYVNSTFTSAQARDHLMPALDSGDKLYVVDASNGSAAWHGMSSEVSQFVLDRWSK
ncbi:CRISPR-associated protein Cas2 [Sphingobium sp. HT1-2]|uniref:CRISPR-associated protein Cas2 n=1 Tax=Sphingobium sp. HT1-2 TaxID=3111640 RepID=UPI003C0D4FDA